MAANLRSKTHRAFARDYLAAYEEVVALPPSSGA
jgi:hypothetical protein